MPMFSISIWNSVASVESFEPDATDSLSFDDNASAKATFCEMLGNVR